MDTKLPWAELTDEERFERFQRLALPDQVTFSNRDDKMEISLPITLLHDVLDKMIHHGYVTFNIDIFHESGVAVIGAMMPRDHAIGKESPRDYL